MPKTVEYLSNGVREVYSKKECHSCWDCLNCRATSNGYVCEARSLSTYRNSKFPFDNTKCKEFKSIDGNS